MCGIKNDQGERDLAIVTGETHNDEGLAHGDERLEVDEAGDEASGEGGDE